MKSAGSHSSFHPFQTCPQVMTGAAEVQPQVLGSVERGTVRETDTSFFEMPHRVFQPQCTYIKPGQISRLHRAESDLGDLLLDELSDERVVVPQIRKQGLTP